MCRDGAAALCAGALALGVLTGCARERETQGDAEAPARPLTIGLAPEHDIFRQLDRYRPLAAALSRAASVPVRLHPAQGYEELVELLDGTLAGQATVASSGGSSPSVRPSPAAGPEVPPLDGAFLGSMAYAAAHLRAGVVPLARIERSDGRSTYHGMIVTRADSDIASIRDLRGRRFAFVDRATTAGWLLPLHEFARAGVPDYRAFLGEAYFAGTHADVIRDVLAGKAEAGAVKDTVLAQLAADDPAIPSRLVVLARSPEVPEIVFAASHRLGDGERALLTRALLGLHESEEGRDALLALSARRFVPAHDGEYEGVYRYASEAGVDLSRPLRDPSPRAGSPRPASPAPPQEAAP